MLCIFLAVTGLIWPNTAFLFHVYALIFNLNYRVPAAVSRLKRLIIEALTNCKAGSPFLNRSMIYIPKILQLKG